MTNQRFVTQRFNTALLNKSLICHKVRRFNTALLNKSTICHKVSAQQGQIYDLLEVVSVQICQLVM